MKRILVKIAMAVFFFIQYSVCSTLAQGPPGISEFGKVTKDMHRYYFNFADLVLVLGAISGMLGGLRVYSNLQKGKHHMDGQVEGWLFSCLFLSLLAAALKALFGVK